MDAAPGRGFDGVGGRINPRVAGALGSYRQPCRLSANGQPPRGGAIAPVEKILNRVARIVDRPAGSKGISGAGIASCRPSWLGGRSNAFGSDRDSEDRGVSRYDRRVDRGSGLSLD